jgi:hypothetical protein
LPKVQPDTTVSLPIGVWRSIVKTLGFQADSAARDTAKGRDTATTKAK